VTPARPLLNQGGVLGQQRVRMLGCHRVQNRKVAVQHDRPSGMLLSCTTTFLASLPAPCRNGRL
jgi:hypothetical protein